MARASAAKASESTRRRPARTIEARENELISLAYDEAERQIRAGTASSQIITHYLKRGSAREKLELERLREENKLLQAKTKAIEKEAEDKIAYQEVIKALQSYNGQSDFDEY